MVNRLAHATSPYLLQHAENPVDWHPWGEDAFAEARRRDVPVLVSIGYSACHWCHVMAHESFEDEATARTMNELFVNVKVDREERPDVDAVYMNATQAMTGHGGWPMTVFATPDGEPFYCGTYFPRPQFQRLLHGVAEAWQNQREQILDQGQRVVAALSQPSPLDSAATPQPTIDAELLAVAHRTLYAEYDTVNGGFGSAPKFPPSMVLEFLLRHHDRTGRTDTSPLEVAEHTAEAMARGGIYDQLGGGFARYSVDEHWTVPHFEKMLYDNALLARSYAHLWRSNGSALARRVALETAEWMVRDLGTPEGGFASARDADSAGEEGLFYVWTPQQLRTALGAADGDWAATVFGVTEQGTFEHGTSVLQLQQDPEDVSRYQSIRQRLAEQRSARVWPERDDKIVAAWNGLAIAALSEVGALFGREDLVNAARTAARLLVDLHLRDGRLLRTSRDGKVGVNAGVLEDYANTAEGLITLYGVTGEAEWVHVAGQLLEVVLARFGDGSGGFYDTPDDAEPLFTRPRDPTDNATPSGQFAAAGALLSYAALTGSQRHRAAAHAALAPLPLLAQRAPRFAGWGLAVAEAFLAGPTEIAVVGQPGSPDREQLHAAALTCTSPGAVIALGDGHQDDGVPLLRGRAPVDDGPAAYVCRQMTCQRPVTSVEQLRRALVEA
ncbi:thioredoxin domain-containing protein [Lipingzhangella sp. LS1_29]|uniref:Thioredoxin domain-containing protein n=1 Tax=Lipingzhangella rawalii TaxID=2055835 RepID=A0ABU2H9Z0_9ACTN|nr:thioredoxin domain-containing protein [Lipingzhangella rawalii]MDS1272144.1 thioredoxin domain-containing protein [Lipingzhangella rawalii]